MLARLRAAEGKADEAAEHLKAVLRSNPSHLEALTMLAAYHESRGRREEAIAQLESALRLNPNLHGVKLRLANLYGQVGRTAEGLARAREAVAAQPSAVGHTVVAELAIADKKWEAAVESAQRALRLNPDFAPAHFALGAAYQQKGDVDRALAAYRRTIALTDKDSRAYNNLAYLLAERRQALDEALAFARKANELTPNNPAIQDTLGWVHYQRGEYQEAAALLAKAAERASNHAAIQYHLGMAYYRLGRTQDAVFALRRALSLDSTMAEAARAREVLKEIGG
jgi:superkiller protein 3